MGKDTLRDISLQIDTLVLVLDALIDYIRWVTGDIGTLEICIFPKIVYAQFR